MLSLSVTIGLLTQIFTSSKAMAATQDSAVLACVRSECGTNNPVAHPFEQTPGLEQSTTQMIQAELRKPLQNYMGRVIHKSLLLDQSFKKLFSLDPSTKVSPNRAALIQSLRALNRVKFYLPALKSDGNGQYVFDPAKLKKLQAMSVAEFNATLTLEKVISASITFTDFLEASSYETVIKSFYPGMTVLEAQKTEALSILQARAALTSLVPLIPTLQTDRLILKRALTGQSLSLSEKTYLKNLIKERVVMGMLLAPEIQEAFQKVPLNLAQFLKESAKAYSESLTGQTFQTPQSLKVTFNQAVGVCYQKLAYAYAAFPTSAQLSTFQGVLKTVEDQAQKMIEEKAHMTMPNGMQLEIYLPQARENLVPDWKAYLIDATSESDQAIRNLKQVDLKNPEIVESLLVALANFHSNHLLEPALSFCAQAQPAFLNDAARPDTNVVTLSWPTIVHPETGAGIVAHELGHIASSAIDSLLANEKTCLKNKQGSDQYIEEDFADLFSTELLNRLGRRIGQLATSNMACGLLERKNGDWSSVSVKNTVSGDSHSSSFYRMLAIANSSTGLTGSCSAYLKQVSATRIEKICRWQK
jgi:hypothetical protein